MVPAELLSCHCHPLLLSPAGGVRPGCSCSLVPVLLWGCAGTADRDRQRARQWHSRPALQHFPPKGGSPPRWTEHSSRAQSAVSRQRRALQPQGTQQPQPRSLASDLTARSLLPQHLPELAWHWLLCVREAGSLAAVPWAGRITTRSLLPGQILGQKGGVL